MPCILSNEEIEHEERRINEEDFGKKLTDAQLSAEVLCQMGRYIYGLGLEKGLPPLAAKFLERHRKEDGKEGRPWRRKKKKGS